MRLTLFAALSFTLFSSSLSAQTPLQNEIRKIAAEAHGRVSVSCSLPGSSLNCDLDPHSHPPMQSVFKLPLAVCALHQIELGKFSLDQPIRFLPSDLFQPQTYSPLQDKYPNANADVPLRELLRLSVSLSDNAAADIVLRLVGGPAVVDAYIKSVGVEGFHLEDGEHGLHRDARAQYRNWLEPAGAVQFLRKISDASPLNPEHTELLLAWMKDSPTGLNRIKGNLPDGTIVIHKTGTSGTHDGKTAATNDIGLIVLPDGRRLAIAIFVTDASADSAAIESTIARIAAAAYSAATH
ncbi:MAG: class A beta-lactamase [Acidobacteria bacterium]|nr:class A beta-lactamase [Acidobacteriota bacterium]MBS1865664.1 class A beta-lactamase [Acidobacteriota bacterium]